MIFTEQRGLLCVEIVTSVRHAFLGLDLVTSRCGPAELQRWPRRRGCGCGEPEPSLVTEAALRGIATANVRLGTQWSARTVAYTPCNSDGAEMHAEAAHAIVQHRAVGGTFCPSSYKGLHDAPAREVASAFFRWQGSTAATWDNGPYHVFLALDLVHDWEEAPQLAWVDRGETCRHDDVDPDELLDVVVGAVHWGNDLYRPAADRERSPVRGRVGSRTP